MTIFAFKKMSFLVLTIDAPDFSYSLSGNPDFSPAPCSMMTSNPILISWATEDGVAATICSFIKYSLGTPTIIFVFELIFLSIIFRRILD